MTELEKYEAVNKCETFEEFEKVLLSFADESGRIQGNSKTFDANKMVEGALDFYNDRMYGSPNLVTRQWGLRQQLMYLKYYK